MIKQRNPLSMAEARDYVSKENSPETLAFIKKFTKLKAKEGKQMREKLEGLDLMKLDDKSISKIIDLLPENAEELNKIFVGISLDEEEIKKILDVVPEFK